jgi:AraC family transcriptional regulator
MSRLCLLQNSRSPAEEGRYRRIAFYIDANLDDGSLSLRGIATRFGLSRSRLQHLFRAEGGVVTHIRRSRTLAASSRLRQDPSLHLTFLLHDMGFSNERQFQRAFHEHLGMSPSRWRRAPVMP